MSQPLAREADVFRATSMLVRRPGSGSASVPMACSECGAREGHLLGCTKSAFHLPPAPVVTPEPPTAPRARRWLVAFPVVFLVMWGVSGTRVGGWLRVFFGMWLHELGHASAAWFCGHGAVPLPWVTLRFERSWLVTALVFGSFVALGAWAWKRRSKPVLALAGVGLGAALVGHVLSPAAKWALFAFSGDAGAMVFGALLASASLLPSSHPLLRDGLRVGWLVIGAASWADATRVWWRARWDSAEIPFGVESFGFGDDGMPSDASRLVDESGWEPRAMVNRFLVVAALSLCACVVALVARWRREAVR
ncbi:MAG: hypothetical protein MUC96_20005 [Myxococcaceae bacterium]|nr:hypothetical protein [Myxococcaceae bacterium]